MSDFEMRAGWVRSDDRDPVLRQTAARLTIAVKGSLLTKNIDVWSGAVHDAIVASASPLAEWLAFSWWRLENELLPDDGQRDFNWRYAHELGAADHGFVWPGLQFVSDGEFMNVEVKPAVMPGQSVCYLDQPNTVQPVPLHEFQREASALIEATIERLSGISEELADLWKIVREDMQNPEVCAERRLEAAMGFDPEECPAELLKALRALQENAGFDPVREMAPLLKADSSLQERLREEKGFAVKLQIPPEKLQQDTSKELLPWQRGVRAARQLRELCGLGSGAVSDTTVRDLLGLSRRDFALYEKQSAGLPVSVGKYDRTGQLMLVPRNKTRASGRRFELSRLLGDALTRHSAGHEWLVSSDCRSARQKQQRAFAAEFLCPIHALESFLAGDYSDSRQEAAAVYFNVSELTVKTQLVNNEKIERVTAFSYTA